MHLFLLKNLSLFFSFLVFCYFVFVHTNICKIEMCAEKCFSNTRVTMPSIFSDAL